MNDNSTKCDSLLINLRKIIRAIDLHSKQLLQKYGLTGPQMFLLKTICQSSNDLMTSTQLANTVSLSQATVTSILDRLAAKSYIKREKSLEDKRKISIQPTDKAKAVFEKNITLLQDDFVAKFDNLKDWEQSIILSSLERIADMMQAESIDAAPVLANAELATTNNLK